MDLASDETERDPSMSHERLDWRTAAMCPDSSDVHLRDSPDSLMYGIEDVPPWYLSVFMGLQHFLSFFGTAVITPLFIADVLCVGNDSSAKAELVCTMLFACGVATFLQATIGVRLPMIEGAAVEFLIVLMAFLGSNKDHCNTVPTTDSSLNSTTTTTTSSNVPQEPYDWHIALRKVQGAVIISGLIEAIIGLTGLIGILRRLISPISIVPALTLLGISLAEPATNFSSKQWGIAALTLACIVLFSQYLADCLVPFPYYSKRRGWHLIKFPFFRLFSVVLSIIIGYIVCLILTLTGAFSNSPSTGYGYYARTDLRTNILHMSPWLYFPYPGQWGAPIFDMSTIVAILPAILASIFDSLGEYYGCARVCHVPQPPDHALNRGIAVEGIGCALSGALGFGGGITTYSGNIGLIAITRVASRRTVQFGAAIMVVLAIFGKFGGLFVTIPDPVIGGSICASMSMFTGIGISNLKKVNVMSGRNIFILGFSIFMGFLSSQWIRNNKAQIDTGVLLLNDFIIGLLGSSMFVGGLLGAFLDNTIKGTKEERGLLEDVQSPHDQEEERVIEVTKLKCYDLPFSKHYINSVNLFKYIPVCPNFNMNFQSLRKLLSRRLIHRHKPTMNNTDQHSNEITSLNESKV